jgi:hypothetical protein
VTASVLAFAVQQRVFLRAADDQASDDVDDLHCAAIKVGESGDGSILLGAAICGIG